MAWTLDVENWWNLVQQLVLWLPNPLASLVPSLTLRTFHMGGVAVSGDITTGLPRVEELFEARREPKGEAVITGISGYATIFQGERSGDQRIIRVEHAEMVADEYEIPEEWTIKVKAQDTVSVGDVIAELGEAQMTAQHTGLIRTGRPQGQRCVRTEGKRGL